MSVVGLYTLYFAKSTSSDFYSNKRSENFGKISSLSENVVCAVIYYIPFPIHYLKDQTLIQKRDPKKEVDVDKLQLDQ